MTDTETIELRFIAGTAEDAQRQAREWCRAEPRLVLRTIASVRRADVGPAWIVACAVRWVDKPEPADVR